MAKKVKNKPIRFGNIRITKNNPGNITTYPNIKTVSTTIFKEGIMIDIHDNRSETKKQGKIVLGPAFVQINKGVDDEVKFKRRVVYLQDSLIKEEKIKLEMMLEGTTIEIKRNGEDIFSKFMT